MSTRISRRSFTNALAGGAVALGAGFHITSGQTPVTSPVSLAESTGGIGLTLADWENLAGPGEPAGDFLVYTSPIDQVTPVTVGFTDEIATFMEYDFSVHGETGLSRDDVAALIASSIPPDSMPGEQFLVPGTGETSGTYAAGIFTSQSLPQMVADATGIMAIQTTVNTGINPDPAEYTSVISATITTNNPPDVEIPATGAPGGIALGRDAWIAAYGEPPQTDYELEQYPGVGPNGMDVAVQYMPQDDIIQRIAASGDGVNVETSPWMDAITFCGNSLPADAMLAQHFYFPGTEAGPLALRAMTFASETVEETLHYKGTVLVLIHESMKAPEPMVPRLDLTINTGDG